MEKKTSQTGVGVKRRGGGEAWDREAGKKRLRNPWENMKKKKKTVGGCWVKKQQGISSLGRANRNWAKGGEVGVSAKG